MELINFNPDKRLVCGLGALAIHKRIWKDLEGDPRPLFMYAFTVTPKGRNREFRYYLDEFVNKLRDVPTFVIGYFYREVFHTNHLHGIVFARDRGYKFMKCRQSSRYVTLCPPVVVGIHEWVKYISKPSKGVTKTEKSLLVIKR